MIKINLGSKKSAPAVAATVTEEKSSKFLGMGLANKLDANDVDRKLLIRRVLVLVVAYLGLDFGYGFYLEDETKKLDVVLNRITVERDKLAAVLQQSQGFEEKKKQLDANEQVLKIKIETLEKLAAGRTLPPEVLKYLAGAIPNEAWLTEFAMQADNTRLVGRSSTLNSVSDFLKTLNESAYFKDVDVKAGSVNEAGEDVATFELNAKRRVL